MEIADLNLLISNHENGKTPTPQDIQVSAENAHVWVRFKLDPKRFVPAIFDGDWAFTNQHPNQGSVRLVKSITGTDGISRLIARQGKSLYAYPWFS